MGTDIIRRRTIDPTIIDRAIARGFIVEARKRIAEPTVLVMREGAPMALTVTKRTPEYAIVTNAGGETFALFLADYVGGEA